MPINDHAALTNTKLLPQPTKPAIVCAKYKSTPQDFIVNEMLVLDFSNQGEHLWLLIKKIGLNTTYVANALAKWAKIPSRDVGYSGLKDRHAVTTQWFSLRIPKGQLPADPFVINDIEQGEFAEVLQQHWHSKKLNRGSHKFNQFIITLRDVEGDEAQIEQALSTIKKQGVPNYFGEQRFGRDGNNINTALEWFEQGSIDGKSIETTVKKGRLSKKEKQAERKNRELKSILLSAARSAIFNQILAQRILNESWQTGLDGEVFNLSGSGSVFASMQMDDELHDRVAKQDIHPTGAMWGVSDENSAKPTGVAAKLEAEVIANCATLQKLAQGLESKALKSARRPLRLLVHNLTWQWLDDQTLVLDFKLPAGSFATSVLAGLIQ